MIERLLLAVHDSPDSLAAARLAVQLARVWHARLRVIHVIADDALDSALEAATGRPSVRKRQMQSATATLARVFALASAAGVDAETELLHGEVGPAILYAAQHWPADLVVVGKSARSASGVPYVGTATRHVLEFADRPVLVVPPADHR